MLQRPNLLQPIVEVFEVVLEDVESSEVASEDVEVIVIVEVTMIVEASEVVLEDVDVLATMYSWCKTFISFLCWHLLPHYVDETQK